MMEWLSAFSKVLIVVTAGGLLGWFVGHPLVGIAVAALAVVFFWSRQMWRLEHWLRDTSGSPPDVSGIWGEMVARVYKQNKVADSTEKRLQSTVDYLLDSFSAMRDGVVIVEGNQSIRWSNEAAQRLLGLQYPEDIGQLITNLVRLPEFNEYLESGDYSQPLVFEMTGNIKRNLQLVVTQFAEGDTLLFLTDVTDLVRTEQMRTDFVGNVSHELRTPLTVISGYLDTFQADVSGLPAPYIRGLKHMTAQARRMESLLKDLLWLSKIESTAHRIKDQRVDMAGLLAELSDEVASLYPDRPLQLQVDSQDSIIGEHRELHSAISNLVLNAYKYSAPDGQVSVSWRREARSLRLEVTDKGIGIDPSHFPRLTERFYRVDESRSSVSGGTGLGLAIVKHVATAHGAHLEINSQPGQGSTFSLVFPLHDQA